MIYIRKRRTPDTINKKADEIRNSFENGYADIKLPEDSKKLRYLFEQMPKDEIRTALYQEQHGLCAYCMRKIEPQHESMKIEHYEALTKNKEGALDYQNYLGVCYGGEKEDDEKPHILCCDAARKDKKLTINPWNERQMEAIAYYRDGEIFVRQDKGLDTELVKKMQNDMDAVLVLNGKKDLKGKRIYDTASKLVASRRSICDSVHSQFERWDKNNCLTVEFLQDKIDRLMIMLERNNIAEESYIGVRLYLYKRKQEKLKRKLGYKYK